MMSRFVLRSLAGWIVVIPAGSMAQATPAYDPLGVTLPGTHGMRVCAEALPTAVDSAHGVSVVVDYAERFDSHYERRIGASYDSTGRIIFLVVSAEDLGNEPKLRMHAVMARFDSSAAGVRFVGEIEIPSSELSLSDSSKHHTPAPPLPIPLTDAEITRAKELAVWLWNGHCGRTARRRAASRSSAPPTRN